MRLWWHHHMAPKCPCVYFISKSCRGELPVWSHIWDSGLCWLVPSFYSVALITLHVFIFLKKPCCFGQLISPEFIPHKHWRFCWCVSVVLFTNLMHFLPLHHVATQAMTQNVTFPTACPTSAEERSFLLCLFDSFQGNGAENRCKSHPRKFTETLAAWWKPKVQKHIQTENGLDLTNLWAHFLVNVWLFLVINYFPLYDTVQISQNLLSTVHLFSLSTSAAFTGNQCTPFISGALCLDFCFLCFCLFFLRKGERSLGK